MRGKGHYFRRALMLTFALFMALSTVVSVSAQDGYWRNSQRRDQREYDREQRRRQREYQRQQRRAERQQRRSNDGYYGNNGYGYGRNNDNYGNYGGSHQLRQTALNAGYNNGMEEGRKDRSRNERYNFADEGDYRSASKDYSSRLGDRYAYQRYFREAFERGYRDGYYGNTGYDNGYYNY